MSGCAVICDTANFAELATVFWEKAMVSMINSGNSVAVFFGYGVFAAVTFAVLLSMDVLECFLHALRLHWVEFQSKFYKADGYRFAPYDFKTIIGKATLDNA
jgi:V-type H+-transporting ATPase subunit a